MKIKQVVVFLILALLFPSLNSWARWVWSPEQGKFVNSQGEAQDTAEEIYQYGEQFHKEKNLDEAIDQMKAVVDKYPESRVGPDAQYKIGVFYEEKGDFLKAFHAYKRLLDSYPKNKHYEETVERLFRIGNAFLSGKKARLWGMEILSSKPRAVEVFKYIVDQAPFSTYGDKASFQLGLAYKQSGKFEEAIQTFQGLIDQHPKSELIADARFQIAETSYQRSLVQNRDQRALDDASQQVERFLTRYPESNTSEKASKIKQVIDETNAEKNYRIGSYYERDKYIQSALIYYTDAAERYPNTQWGMKAKEKIKFLKEPAAYHANKEKQIDEESKIIEAKIKVLEPGQKVEKERLERKLEVLKKHQKNLEKDKKGNYNSIREDIKRREGEIKEKFKNLQKKKKNNKNPTEDFKNAMQRWEASLHDEREQLEREKKQLAGWREDLGISDRPFGMDFLPFMGEASDLDKVRGIEAKELFKLSVVRKDILDEKELLYKHRSEVMTRVDEVAGKAGPKSDDSWMKSLDQNNEEVKKHQKNLTGIQEKIKSLESQIESKRKEYEKYFEESSSRLENLYKVPAQVITNSTQAVSKTLASSLDKSFQAINPFDGAKSGNAQKDIQQLLEREMHLKEKAASQQNLVDTLSQAFDEELAIKEQKRLMQGLAQESNTKVDPIQLRKETKKIQKTIRAHYQQIEDLDREKAELLKKLDALYHAQAEQLSGMVKAGNAIGTPVKKTAGIVKAFFVGLPDEGVETTKKVEKLPENTEIQTKAKALKQEIELKSLLIEAKSQEIIKYQKQLEILRAKASFAGGVKFRSVFIDVPYEFMGEAIDQARKMIPKKEREQAIADRLEKENAKLKETKQELQDLKLKITQKQTELEAVEESAKTETVVEPKAEFEKKTDFSEHAVEINRLKTEIEMLMNELKAAREEYAKEEEILKKMAEENRGKTKKEKKIEKILRQEAKKKEGEVGALRDELSDIENHLQRMINKESKLEVQETSILEKRIARIDKMIPTIASQANAQDLLREREQMQNRLSQLALRRDFLSKEIERFQPTETGK